MNYYASQNKVLGLASERVIQEDLPEKENVEQFFFSSSFGLLFLGLVSMLGGGKSH